MVKGKCPHCGGERLRYSASLLRHLSRAAIGSPKRYCVQCRTKWLAEDATAAPSVLKEYAGLAIMGVVALVLGILCLGVALHPVETVKSLVRKDSDDAYHKDSQKRLWNAFGWLYGSKRDAKDDYWKH